MAARILVIGGSVRPNRLSPSIAKWVAKVGVEVTGQDFEYVDLREWPLPVDGEPGMPASGDYVSAETKAWSRKIASGDAFVFVTPEYNGGYPGVLKNAIDHLFQEWKGKPAAIVTYGGGAAGARSGTQLFDITRNVGLKTLELRPKFAVPREILYANAGQIDAAAELGAQDADLKKALAALGEAIKETKL